MTNMKNSHKTLLGEYEGIYNLGDKGKDKRIILKRISGARWKTLSWVKIGSSS
jgi:hypothetical protein